jgi:hypothetical protein
LAIGERKEEAIPFLRWIKELLGKDPEFITIDFDDTWFISVTIVFPDATIIICTFHAIKLLTGGLLKEFNHRQRRTNTIFIKECGIARNLSFTIENDDVLPALPAITQEFCSRWLDFFVEINAICRLDHASAFTCSYKALFVAIRSWNPAIADKVEKEVAPKVPASGFNKRNMKYFKARMKMKWRGILRDRRGTQEEQKHAFAEAKYLLLKKPENLKEWEKEKMDTFLKDNSWAGPYRTTLLQFYKLFDDSSCEDPSLDFLDAIVNTDSCDELKAAIATLKAKKKYIFNYVSALKKYPEWKNFPSFKLNHEPFMKRINDLKRVQYGLRSDENGAYKLAQFLKCPVMQSQSVLNDKG